jgi:outer membrane protein assembly factor BamB
MNGVLYLAGGGDGMFHAIDAANGKEIWKIPCPEANRNIYFYGHVTGADGKVFVSSYTTMYCYKAAR